MEAQAVNGSGLSGIVNLRQRFPLMGIVVITEKNDDAGHVRALQEGADHFLPRSVSLSVLSATVGALFRRVHVHVDARQEPVRVWKFNRRSQVLSGPCGTRINFSDRESAILTMLFLNPHFPVSTERLLHALNMSVEIFDPHRVDTIIYRIRKKLNQGSGAAFEIRNIYGQGYMCIGSEGDAVFHVWDGQ